MLRVEGKNYFLKRRDCKAVRWHTDQTTEKAGNIQQGDRLARSPVTRVTLLTGERC